MLNLKDKVSYEDKEYEIIGIMNYYDKDLRKDVTKYGVLINNKIVYMFENLFVKINIER